MFQKVIIIGAGLIGSSIAHSLKQKNLAADIAFIEASKECHPDIEAAGFKVVTKAELRQADCVVLAIPVLAIPELLDQIHLIVASDALVMDVGSMKAPIVKAARAIPNFIGAHPIAGKETFGFTAGEAGLFDSRAVILTPTEMTHAKALAKAWEFWEALGGIVYEMTPEEHDLCFAKYSHLSNLLSFVLMAQHDKKPQLTSELLPPSFVGMTRLAASSPVMWKDICLTNRDAILQSIEGFEKDLSRLKALIQKQDADGLLKFLER